MNHESRDTHSTRSTVRTMSSAPLWTLLALGIGAGCAMEGEVQGVEAEQHAGAATGGTELRTGMIATEKGTLEIRYELIDGLAVVEGDMVFPLGDILDPDAAHSGTIPRANRWPGGVIPYAIDPSLTDQGRVTNAVAHWNQTTLVRLVPRTTQADYVLFVPSTGCSSYLGRIGGAQQIWLAPGCSTGNTIHEIGHAFGLWHEQSRADRDNHVTIHTANIQAGYEGNFAKYSAGMDVGNYDFGSIMHYPWNAFSSNGQPTITRKDGSTFNVQRDALSPIDRLGAHVLYSNQAAGDDMQPADMLYPGQSLYSPSGAHRFTYQTDGNLVVYRNGVAVWASNTWGQAAGALLMQTDGNLVVYRPDGAAIFASATHGSANAGSRLVVQNDGNVVIYRPNGTPIWHTNTWQ